MIFTSIYGIVDGIFVSNCVGSDAFAAVNLIMPVIMILGTLGFMVGTGGSALVSKTIGEGEKEKRPGSQPEQSFIVSGKDIGKGSCQRIGGGKHDYGKCSHKHHGLP